MIQYKKMNSAIESISAILVFLFLYTGVSKYLSFHAFQTVLGESTIISKHAHYIALILPALEIITTILLTIPKMRIWGLYVSLALLLSFTAYLIYMVNYAPNLPCSCGGIIQQLSWSQHIILNSLLSLATITAIYLYRKISRNTLKNQASVRVPIQNIL